MTTASSPDKLEVSLRLSFQGSCPTRLWLWEQFQQSKEEEAMPLSSLPQQGEPSCISSRLPWADPAKGHPARVDVVKDAHHILQSRSQVWEQCPSPEGLTSSWRSNNILTPPNYVCTKMSGSAWFWALSSWEEHYINIGELFLVLKISLVSLLSSALSRIKYLWISMWKALHNALRNILSSNLTVGSERFPSISPLILQWTLHKMHPYARPKVSFRVTCALPQKGFKSLMGKCTLFLSTNTVKGFK